VAVYGPARRKRTADATSLSRRVVVVADNHISGGRRRGRSCRSHGEATGQVLELLAYLESASVAVVVFSIAVTCWLVAVATLFSWMSGFVLTALLTTRIHRKCLCRSHRQECMSRESGRFTSDRRDPGQSVWRGQEDWESGVSDGVSVVGGDLVYESAIHPIYGSDFYFFDDWGDGGLETRDSTSEVSYNGATGQYRPSWTTDAGSPNVVDGALEINSGDGVLCDVDLNLNEEVTWLWKNVDPRRGGTGNSDESSLQLWSESTSRLSGYPSETLYPGYLLEIRRRASADELRLSKILADQSVERLVFKASVSWPKDIQVKRSVSGEWRVWLGDHLVGSAVDTELDSPQYIGFGGRSAQNIGLRIEEFVVF